MLDLIISWLEKIFELICIQNKSNDVLFLKTLSKESLFLPKCVWDISLYTCIIVYNPFKSTSNFDG